MKVIQISELNKLIEQDESAFIKNGANYYRESLNKTALEIEKRFATHSIVLISGPSGSGKTTTATRLKSLLAEKGIQSLTISMDDYFIPIDESDNHPRNPDGTIDLESPYRVDIPLLKKHIEMLNNFEEIHIPKFDFATNSIVGFTNVKREKNQIVILEGIHALNPLITADCHDYSTRIYVSVRTRVENSSLDRLHPRLIRLMRRCSRDVLFRGREINQTFDMFKSVSRGEEAHITRFKELADFEIDTFIPFELSAYKSTIYTALLKRKEEMHGEFDFDMVLEFLKEVKAIDNEKIPDNSLIREFIGGKKV